ERSRTGASSGGRRTAEDYAPASDQAARRVSDDYDPCAGSRKWPACPRCVRRARSRTEQRMEDGWARSDGRERTARHARTGLGSRAGDVPPHVRPVGLSSRARAHAAVLSFGDGHVHRPRHGRALSRAALDQPLRVQHVSWKLMKGGNGGNGNGGYGGNGTVSSVPSVPVAW